MTTSNGFTPEPGQDPIHDQQGHPGPGSQSGDEQLAGRPDPDGFGHDEDSQRLEESQDEGFGGTQPEHDDPA